MTIPRQWTYVQFTSRQEIENNGLSNSNTLEPTVGATEVVPAPTLSGSNQHTIFAVWVTIVLVMSVTITLAVFAHWLTIRRRSKAGSDTRNLYDARRRRLGDETQTRENERHAAPLNGLPTYGEATSGDSSSSS